MVTHPLGLRDREQRGDDPAKDFCPHASPSRGFGDACRGVAGSPPLQLRGREGVCSSANWRGGGRNPPTGPSPGTPMRLAEAEMVLSASGHFYILFPLGSPHCHQLGVSAREPAGDRGSCCGMGTDPVPGANQPPRRGALPRHPISPAPGIGTAPPTPAKDLSTLSALQRSQSGVPQETPCASPWWSPPGACPQLGGHSQVTLSPVFILLLEENSFRDRVTSLGRGGGHSCQRGGDSNRGVGGNAEPTSHPAGKLPTGTLTGTPRRCVCGAR